MEHDDELLQQGTVVEPPTANGGGVGVGVGAWALDELYSTKRELRVLARILHLPLHAHPRVERGGLQGSAPVVPLHSDRDDDATAGQLLRVDSSPASRSAPSHNVATPNAHATHGASPADTFAATGTASASYAHSAVAAASAAAAAAAASVVPPALPAPSAVGSYPPPMGDLSAARLKGQELDRLVEQLARWNEQVSLEAQTATARAQSAQRALHEVHASTSTSASEPESASSEPGSPIAVSSEPRRSPPHMQQHRGVGAVRGAGADDARGAAHDFDVADNAPWGTETDSGCEAPRVASARPTMSAPPDHEWNGAANFSAVPSVQPSKAGGYDGLHTSSGGDSSNGHGGGVNGGHAYRGSNSARSSRRHTAQDGLGLRVSWGDDDSSSVPAQAQVRVAPASVSVPTSALSSPHFGGLPAPVPMVPARAPGLGPSPGPGPGRGPGTSSSPAPAPVPSPSQLWQRHHRDIAQRSDAHESAHAFAPAHTNQAHDDDDEEEAEFAHTCAQLDAEMHEDSFLATGSATIHSARTTNNSARANQAYDDGSTRVAAGSSTDDGPFAPWTPAMAHSASSHSHSHSHSHHSRTPRSEREEGYTRADPGGVNVTSPAWAFSPISMSGGAHQQQHSTPVHAAPSSQRQQSPPLRQPAPQQPPQPSPYYAVRSSTPGAPPKPTSDELHPNDQLQHSTAHNQQQQQQQQRTSLHHRQSSMPVQPDSQQQHQYQYQQQQQQPQANGPRTASSTPVQSQANYARTPAHMQARSSRNGSMTESPTFVVDETAVADASVDRTVHMHATQQRSSSRPPPARAVAQTNHRRAQSGQVHPPPQAQTRRTAPLNSIAVPRAVVRTVARAPHKSSLPASPPHAASSVGNVSQSMADSQPSPLPVEVSSRLVVPPRAAGDHWRKGSSSGTTAGASTGAGAGIGSRARASQTAAPPAMVRVETCLRVGGVDVGAASAEACTYEEAESAALQAVLAQAGPSHARALLGPAVALQEEEEEQEQYVWEPDASDDTPLDGTRRWGPRGRPLSAPYFATPNQAKSSTAATATTASAQPDSTPLSPTRPQSFVSETAARTGLLYSPDASSSTGAPLHWHELSGLIPPAVVRSLAPRVDAGQMSTTQQFAQNHRTQYVPSPEYFMQRAYEAQGMDPLGQGLQQQQQHEQHEAHMGDGDGSAPAGPSLAMRQRLQQHLYRKAQWADIEAEEAAREEWERACSPPHPDASASAAAASAASPDRPSHPERDPQQLYAVESALGVSPRRQLLHHFLSLRARKFPNLPGEVGVLRSFARQRGVGAVGAHAPEKQPSLSEEDVAALQGRPLRPFASPKDAAAFLARMRSLQSAHAPLEHAMRSADLNASPSAPPSSSSSGAAVQQQNGPWRRYRWQWKPSARIVPQTAQAQAQTHSHSNRLASQNRGSTPSAQQRRQLQQQRVHSHHHRSQSAVSFSSPLLRSSTAVAGATPSPAHPNGTGSGSPLWLVGAALRPALPAVDLPVDEWARSNLFELAQMRAPHMSDPDSYGVIAADEAATASSPSLAPNAHSHSGPTHSDPTHSLRTGVAASTDLHSERARFAEPHPWTPSAHEQRPREWEQQQHQAEEERMRDEWQEEEEEAKYAEPSWAPAPLPQQQQQQQQQLEDEHLHHSAAALLSQPLDRRDWARDTLRRLDARQQLEAQRQVRRDPQPAHALPVSRSSPSGLLQLHHLASPPPVDGGRAFHQHDDAMRFQA